MKKCRGQCRRCLRNRPRSCVWHLSILIFFLPCLFLTLNDWLTGNEPLFFPKWTDSLCLVMSFFAPNLCPQMSQAWFLSFICTNLWCRFKKVLLVKDFPHCWHLFLKGFCSSMSVACSPPLLCCSSLVEMLVPFWKDWDALDKVNQALAALIGSAVREVHPQVEAHNVPTWWFPKFLRLLCLATDPFGPPWHARPRLGVD